VEAVISIRKEQPRVGTRKMLLDVNKQLKTSNISIGRDRLFEVLREHQMLVIRKKKYHKTTYSNHAYVVATNKIKGIEITHPSQVLVSDITYINLRSGHAYLFLTTDLYSRKILGYHLSRDLSHHSALLALDMALAEIPDPCGTIHHSDRGCQYCCHDFLSFLQLHKMVPSMTAESHCYENAHAERVNGILKEEFDLDQVFQDFNHAKHAVRMSISIYNNKRRHWSLELQTPSQVYKLAA
jgi:putative transposase